MREKRYYTLDKIEAIRKSFPYSSSLPKNIPVSYKITIDNNLVKKIINFIKTSHDNLQKIGLEGVVIGLSGGIDSSVCAMLAKKALGRERVHAVVIDYSIFERELVTLNNARKFGNDLDLDHSIIKIGDVIKRYGQEDYKLTTFFDLNLQTRLIQNELFQIADDRMSTVISTIDRSERLLGRYMEFFYGHIEPLYDLYKTEVYDLAKVLGGPDYIFQTRPGCENWMWDDDIFGTTYDVLDAVLYLITEKGMSVGEVAKDYNIDLKWLQGIDGRMRHQQFRIQPQRLYKLRNEDTKQNYTL